MIRQALLGIKVPMTRVDFNQRPEDLRDNKSSFYSLKMNKTFATVLVLLVASAVTEAKAASLSEGEAASLNEATKQQLFRGK